MYFLLETCRQILYIRTYIYIQKAAVQSWKKIVNLFIDNKQRIFRILKKNERFYFYKTLDA